MFSCLAQNKNKLFYLEIMKILKSLPKPNNDVFEISSKSKAHVKKSSI